MSDSPSPRVPLTDLTAQEREAAYAMWESTIASPMALLYPDRLIEVAHAAIVEVRRLAAVPALATEREAEPLTESGVVPVTGGCHRDTPDNHQHVGQNDSSASPDGGKALFKARDTGITPPAPVASPELERCTCLKVVTVRDGEYVRLHLEGCPCAATESERFVGFDRARDGSETHATVRRDPDGTLTVEKVEHFPSPPAGPETGWLTMTAVEARGEDLHLLPNRAGDAERNRVLCHRFGAEAVAQRRRAEEAERERDKAVLSLLASGFVDNGGEAWKPPVNTRVTELRERLTASESSRAAALKLAGEAVAEADRLADGRPVSDTIRSRLAALGPDTGEAKDG